MAPATASDNPLVTVLELLQADGPADIMGAPEAWPRWAVLLPHVLAATSHLPTVPDRAHPAAQMRHGCWIALPLICRSTPA